MKCVAKFVGRLLFVVVALCFGSAVAFADPAYVINDGSIIYISPDFDGKHLTEVNVGESLEVSKRAFGAFHRVRLKDGRVGFIADNDYKLGIMSQKKPNKEEKSKIRSRAFAATRFRGLGLNYVAYRENTMGLSPTSNTLFYGFKAFGPNLLVDGDLVTEFNADLHYGAPDFYAEATGQSTSGWILHLDAMLESIFAQGRNVNTYAGFGPMLRYSRYQVSINNSGAVNSYDLQDIVFGVVLNAGVGVRLGEQAVRVELKYYWEKMQYFGAGFAFGFAF